MKNHHHALLAKLKHILLDCTVFNVNRQRVYSEVCLTDLFKNVSPECILEFLSGVDLKRLFKQLYNFFRDHHENSLDAGMVLKSE